MTPEEAFSKCLIKEKRILELENIISIDPYYSYLYANHIIKGYWKIGEDTISSNSKWSYFYALNIIKGPWELGEKSLLKNCLWSFEYAQNVIKGPFQKCHPIIFDSEFRDDYIDFLKSINYDLNKISEWLI
jgi:hypothetical protein